jgi:hypothetical protein
LTTGLAIYCVGTFFLKYVIEGRRKKSLEMTIRRGRRRPEQLLDDLKEKRG